MAHRGSGASGDSQHNCRRGFAGDRSLPSGCGNHDRTVRARRSSDESPTVVLTDGRVCVIAHGRPTIGQREVARPRQGSVLRRMRCAPARGRKPERGAGGAVAMERSGAALIQLQLNRAAQGHSVAVLLRVYVRCISGQQDEAKRRIERATMPGTGS